MAEHLICNEEAPVRFWLGPQTIKLLRSISEGLVGFSVLALLPHPEKFRIVFSHKTSDDDLRLFAHKPKVFVEVPVGNSQLIEAAFRRVINARSEINFGNSGPVAGGKTHRARLAG